MSDFFLGKTQAREVDGRCHGRCHGRYHGRCRMREILCTKTFQTKKGRCCLFLFWLAWQSTQIRRRQTAWKFARSKVEVCLEQRRSMLGAKSVLPKSYIVFVTLDIRKGLRTFLKVCCMIEISIFLFLFDGFFILLWRISHTLPKVYPRCTQGVPKVKRLALPWIEPEYCLSSVWIEWRNKFVSNN